MSSGAASANASHSSNDKKRRNSSRQLDEELLLEQEAERPLKRWRESSESDDVRAIIARGRAFHKVHQRAGMRAAKAILSLCEISECQVNHAAIAAWLPTLKHLSDEEWRVVIEQVVPLVRQERKAEKRFLRRLDDDAELVAIKTAVVAALMTAHEDDSDGEEVVEEAEATFGTLSELATELERNSARQRQGLAASLRTTETAIILETMLLLNVRHARDLPDVDRQVYEELFGAEE